jgi:hypothetical protein
MVDAKSEKFKQIVAYVKKSELETSSELPLLYNWITNNWNQVDFPLSHVEKGMISKSVGGLVRHYYRDSSGGVKSFSIQDASRLTVEQIQIIPPIKTYAVFLQAFFQELVRVL